MAAVAPHQRQKNPESAVAVTRVSVLRKRPWPDHASYTEVPVPPPPDPFTATRRRRLREKTRTVLAQPHPREVTSSLLEQRTRTLEAETEKRVRLSSATRPMMRYSARYVPPQLHQHVNGYVKFVAKRSVSVCTCSIVSLPLLPFGHSMLVLGRATGPGNHAASATFRKTVLPQLNVRLLNTRLSTPSAPDPSANLTAIHILARPAHWRPWWAPRAAYSGHL